MSDGFLSDQKVNWKVSAPLFLGAALYWPLLRRNGLFFSLGGHDATDIESMAWLTAFLILCAVIVLLCCLAKNKVKDLFERHHLGVIALFAVQTTCKMLEMFVSPRGLLGFALACIDVALFALVFVTLTYLWASWYLTMNWRQSTVYASTTFVASFILLDATRLLPQVAGLVVFALFPLASVSLWMMSCKKAGLHVFGPPHARVGHISSPLTRYLVIALAVFLLVGGLIRGAMTDVVDGSLAPEQPALDFVTCLFGLMVAALALSHQSPHRLILNAWSAAVVVFFAGLLITAAFGGNSVESGRRVVILGRTCLDLIYWIVLVGLARDSRLNVARTIGVGFILVDALSSFFGYVCAPLALRAAGVSYSSIAVPLATAMAFILVIATILLFNHAFNSGAESLQEFDLAQGLKGLKGSEDLENLEPPRNNTLATNSSTANPATNGSSSAFIEAALAPYQLTERELEVARLLAEGNSQKKIAESTCLSLGTVQSHIKNIYRKLDIHSRQELIDLTH